jgi:glycosyltransferase involved in cell wall biosynthesis
MKPQSKTIVLLPACNAAKTLEKTYADIPKERVAKIIFVDDVSQDQTVEVAQALGLQWSPMFRTGVMEEIRRPDASRLYSAEG